MRGSERRRGGYGGEGRRKGRGGQWNKWEYRNTKLIADRSTGSQSSRSSRLNITMIHKITDVFNISGILKDYRIGRLQLNRCILHITK